VEREEAADVGAPDADAGKSHAETFAHRRREAVVSPVRRRVSTPHDLRTASDAGPARALEADDRPTLSTREVVSRAVVVGDEAIGGGAARGAVPGAGAG